MANIFGVIGFILLCISIIGAAFVARKEQNEEILNLIDDETSIENEVDVIDD